MWKLMLDDCVGEICSRQAKPLQDKMQIYMLQRFRKEAGSPIYKCSALKSLKKPGLILNQSGMSV